MCIRDSYNAFSLENDITMPNSLRESENNSNNPMMEIISHIEKTGHSFDVIYISSEILIEKYTSILEDPINELLQFLNAVSYTHLDVYKRQSLLMRPSQSVDGS